MLKIKYHLIVNGQVVNTFDAREDAVMLGSMYVNTGWNPDNIKIQKAKYIVANVQE